MHKQQIRHFSFYGCYIQGLNCKRLCAFAVQLVCMTRTNKFETGIIHSGKIVKTNECYFI